MASAAASFTNNGSVVNAGPSTRDDFFPCKLYKILTDAAREGNEHIISWLSDDQSFKIHHRVLFVEQILPRYYSNRTIHIRSFLRQLNLYGFQRDDDKHSKFFGSYKHGSFDRNKPENCNGIRRTKVKNTTTTTMATATTMRRRPQQTRRNSTTASSSSSGIPTSSSRGVPSIISCSRGGMANGSTKNANKDEKKDLEQIHSLIASLFLSNNKGYGNDEQQEDHNSKHHNHKATIEQILDQLAPTPFPPAGGAGEEDPFLLATTTTCTTTTNFFVHDDDDFEFYD